MRPLYVCTMVFSRYDCLQRLFASIAASSRRPDGVYVIDHGYDASKIEAVRPALDGVPLEIVTLEDPGCAHAANWFARNVPDDRIGCGDDVIFESRTLEIMAATDGDVIVPEHAEATAEGVRVLNNQACWLLRQPCIDKVGLYDERISPQYLYFEDTDYVRRMGFAGVTPVVAKGAHVVHLNGGSQTYLSYTPAQFEEHCRRFAIAEANYAAKWGGKPFEETLIVPKELP